MTNVIAAKVPASFLSIDLSTLGTLVPFSDITAGSDVVAVRAYSNSALFVSMPFHTDSPADVKNDTLSGKCSNDDEVSYLNDAGMDWYLVDAEKPFDWAAGGELIGFEDIAEGDRIRYIGASPISLDIEEFIANEFGGTDDDLWVSDNSGIHAFWKGYGNWVKLS